MTQNYPTPPPPPSPLPPRSRNALGLPIWVLVCLAMLSVPRIFAHDLGVDSGPIYGILTIGPLVVWIFVVLRARVPSPILTLLAVGAIYGIALGIVHNIFWDQVFGDNEPMLGNLDADTAEVPLRLAAFASSVFTGVAIGVISGLIASAIRTISRARR
jgi:hypothetical protein